MTQGFSLQKSVEMYSIKEIPWNGEAAKQDSNNVPWILIPSLHNPTTAVP
jgi:hypothetical protein